MHPNDHMSISIPNESPNSTCKQEKRTKEMAFYKLLLKQKSKPRCNIKLHQSRANSHLEMTALLELGKLVVFCTFQEFFSTSPFFLLSQYFNSWIQPITLLLIQTQIPSENTECCFLSHSCQNVIVPIKTFENHSLMPNSSGICILYIAIATRLFRSSDIMRL